jgi:iron(III) transport system ATP-binding protein
MASERNIGFVFQSYALFPHLPVFENVAYGLRVQRQADVEISRRVGEVLDLVGLAGYDRQMPHQLSGGEQQRVALARAIVIRPRVLLFDEPLSNLDARLRVQMRGEIQRLQKALGITAVYVTHDQEEAMAISDRIAVMHQGVVVQDGSAESLYHRPASEFVAQFIGRTNLVRGRVAAAGPAGVEVEAPGFRLPGFKLVVVQPGLRAAVGAAVTLVLRPESISLSAGGTGLRGTIVSRTFLGEKVEYHVRVGGESLQVTAYGAAGTRILAPGDAVTLEVPATGVWLLGGGV